MEIIDFEQNAKKFEICVRAVIGLADRPVRSGPIKDLLPAGLDFFSNFSMFFLKKLSIKAFFVGNQTLFTDVENYFCEKMNQTILFSQNSS